MRLHTSKNNRGKNHPIRNLFVNNYLKITVNINFWMEGVYED